MCNGAPRFTFEVGNGKLVSRKETNYTKIRKPEKDFPAEFVFVREIGKFLY
jgi:hypothetical protein